MAKNENSPARLRSRNRTVLTRSYSRTHLTSQEDKIRAALPRHAVQLRVNKQRAKRILACEAIHAAATRHA